MRPQTRRCLDELFDPQYLRGAGSALNRKGLARRGSIPTRPRGNVDDVLLLRDRRRLLRTADAR